MAGRKARKGRKTRNRPPQLADLTPDQVNRRRRTPRGARMLAETLAKVGAARSIVIDEHNGVLAGNGVLAAAVEAGITKLQIIDADGSTLIAVRRHGLTPDQKRELAIADNRAAELAEWNPEQLADDLANGRSLAPFFDEKEIARLLKTTTPADVQVSEVQTGDVQDRFWIAVAGPLPAQARALERLRELMRELDGVTVELGTVPGEAWG